MARPIMEPISITDPDWYVKLNNNFEKLLDDPYPIPQLTVEGSLNPWTPENSDAPKELWLDPKDASTVTESGGNLTQLDDKSGNGYHASPTGTVTYSAVSGKVTIGGTASDYLTSSHPSMSLADWTCFFVFQPLSENVFGRYLSWTTGVDYTTSDRMYIARNGASNEVIVATADGGGSPVTFSSAISSDVSSPYILCGTGSGSSIEGFRDGVSGGTTTWSSFVFENPATIFGEGDAPTGLDLCEFILVSNSLTVEERQRYEGYLAWRHGIESQLPAGHPYEFATPIIGLSFLEDPRLFLECLGVDSQSLYTSNGGTWDELNHKQLDFIPDLDTGTATLTDVRTAFNSLLADMRTKLWIR